MVKLPDVLQGLKRSNGWTIVISSKIERRVTQRRHVQKLMNSYKDQVASLQTRNSALSVDNTGLLTQLESARNDRERLEADRIRDQEHLQSLSDKLREMELGGQDGK